MNIHVVVTINEDLIPSFTQPYLINQSKAISRVTLLANTHKTIIRIAELSKHDRWLTPKTKWRLVQENFPFGTLLNEDTHIFDGTLFTNKAGKRCFLMAALPKIISEAIADMSIKNWGNIHKIQRLDTLEHMMFKHYAHVADKSRDETGKRIKNHAPQWVIIPQEEGYRILVLDEGLPKNTYRVSNHPELREAELDLVLDVAVPSNIVILSFNSNNKADGLKSNNSWIESYAKKHGIVEIGHEFFTNA